MKKWKIKYAAFSIVGQRKRNEDNMLCDGRLLPPDNKGCGELLTGAISDPEEEIFAVFDGIGGEQAGNIASYIGAGGLKEMYPGEEKKDPRGLCELCRELNRRICAYAEEHHIRSMGTTLAMVVFRKGTVTGVNLGDSRIYQYHGGELMRRSTDHAQAGGFLGGRALTQFLGVPPEEYALSPAITKTTCGERELFLLCSDGVTDTLTETELLEIMRQRNSTEEKADRIRREVEKRQGKDNATAILLEVTSSGGTFLQTLFGRRQG